MNQPTPFEIWRRKVRLVALSPAVLWPVVIGAAGLAWHMAPPDGVFSWLMVGSIAWGSMNAVRRWWGQSEQLTDLALKDFQNQTRRRHVTQLNLLRRELRTDRDPRTTQMARRLQELYERMLQLSPVYSRHPSSLRPIAQEILDHAAELYNSCLDLLQKSLHLWRTARQLSTDTARNQMLESRENLIQEIEASIQNLESTLDTLQTSQLQHRELESTENARLRDELRQGLDVAREVQRRMDDLERGIEQRERS